MCRSRKKAHPIQSQDNVLDSNRELEVEYWSKVWPTVQDAAMQSEEHIDKKVFTISVGAIGLELTLLELVAGKSHDWYWIAFLAAGFFVIALLLNLVVHLVGRRFQFRQSKMIKNFIHESPHALQSYEMYEVMEKHSYRILWINICSSIFAIIGVILLFVFSYLKFS